MKNKDINDKNKLIIPKLKPRNPLGLLRKAVRKHKNKKKEQKEIPE